MKPEALTSAIHDSVTSAPAERHRQTDTSVTSSTSARREDALNLTPLQGLRDLLAGASGAKGIRAIKQSNPLEALGAAAHASDARAAAELRIAARQLTTDVDRQIAENPGNDHQSAAQCIDGARAKVLLAWADKVEKGLPARTVDRAAVVSKEMRGLDNAILTRDERKAKNELLSAALDSATLARWTRTPIALAKLQHAAVRGREKIAGVHRGPVNEAVEELETVREQLAMRHGEALIAPRNEHLAIDARLLCAAIDHVTSSLVAGKPPSNLTDIKTLAGKISRELGTTQRAIEQRPMFSALRRRTLNAETIAELVKEVDPDADVTFNAFHRVDHFAALRQSPQTRGAAATARLSALARVQGSDPSQASTHTLAVDKSLGVVINPVIEVPMGFKAPGFHVGPYVQPTLLAAEKRYGGGLTFSATPNGMQLEYRQSNGHQFKQGIEFGAKLGVSVPGIQISTAAGVNAHVSRTASRDDAIVLKARQDPAGAHDRRQRPAAILSQTIKLLGRQPAIADSSAIAQAVLDAQQALTIGVKQTSSRNYSVDASITANAKFGVSPMPSGLNVGAVASVAHNRTNGMKVRESVDVQRNSAGAPERRGEPVKVFEDISSSKTEIPIRMNMGTPPVDPDVHQAGANVSLQTLTPSSRSTSSATDSSGTTRKFSDWNDVIRYCKEHGYTIPAALTAEMTRNSSSKSFTLVEAGVRSNNNERPGARLLVSDVETKRYNAWLPFSFLIKFSKVASSTQTRQAGEYRLGTAENA